MDNLRTMTTQFLDGVPNGVNICHCNRSVIKAVYIPRPLLSRAKKIPDLPLQGIYYLIDDKDEGLSCLYVGKTTQGIARLDDHEVKKDFWNKAILFLSTDTQTFSLDTISALEKFAIEKAAASKRYAVDNKVDPRQEIRPDQISDIKSLYEEIAFIMESFGYQLEDVDESKTAGEIVYTSRRGIRAFGVFTPGGFDVLEGSPIDLTVSPKLERYEKMRAALMDAGDLVAQPDGTALLQKIVTFKTPSGAADFVLGGSNNGWIEWKDETGQTLDALYRR